MSVKSLKSGSLVLALVLVTHFIGLLTCLYAQEKTKEKYPQARNYTVKKALSRIKIDGVLDEDAWKDPEKIEIPFE